MKFEKINNPKIGKLEGNFEIISVKNNAIIGTALINATYDNIESLPYAVPNVTFPLRENCRVTLYQDAHIGSANDIIPAVDVNTEGAAWNYVRPNCWEAIYESISNAKRFIYITGWSIHTQTHLLRENRPTTALPLGELLVEKANQGVRVIVFVWNEFTTSRAKDEGLMNTGDEATKSFFEKTRVHVKLAYREDEMLIGSAVWSHHQKTIILDADPLASDAPKRRIIAYVGGLDLTSGRWDTPRFSLYSTLDTEHRGDFYQPWPGLTAESGPRMPWHDIHSRVEGPAARDVLRNFEQRWRKQAADRLDNLLPVDDSFLTIDEEAMPAGDTPYEAAWNVQQFRSIDKTSAIMENECISVEADIHLAYIHNIRRAKRFIYIENQYFMGSSQFWDLSKADPAQSVNRIPYEIATRIAKAIKERTDFRVYVVIPLFPEGEPANLPMQDMLRWQRKTIEMMYRIIYNALESENLSREFSVEDYLCFCALGQRETLPQGSAVLKSQPSLFTPPSHKRVMQSRRFQVYVHSKMMIVDDEYIIVGSANINQRSMDGTRDTEIAVGAYQPRFTGENAKGIVHAFRVGLWSAHFRSTIPGIETPESLDCIRYFNAKASGSWATYCSPAVVSLDSVGVIMKYPVKYEKSGLVALGDGLVPDTEAKFLGSDGIVPNFITT